MKPVYATTKNHEADDGEIEVIEQAKRRDEQAFLILIQRYTSVIQAVVAKYIRNIRDYEEDDIVKMVVVYVWEKISDFRDGEEGFKCWVSRKTNWICLDILKQQQQAGDPIPIDALNDHEQQYPRNHDPTPLETVLTEEKEQLLQNAMNALPDAYQAVLALRYRGLSYTQIAEILNIEINTVGTRLNRGIKMIQTELEKADVL
ncbi:RNA polymerase, sigma-24 subunit, ECF subfamily [Candidatus Vecturithrix granuli]|uniref:RNA polymerase, sigma-24 subunit, ECF subfamily n=1 Tax=Vecturithrix granuli TaxID=1499967 RepID=A0A081C6J1_VECG1|nr:RNA polymerase, sigma-24 subunit, ECF subfamily [Candidatus Vecturithrix granuli]